MIIDMTGSPVASGPATTDPAAAAPPDTGGMVTAAAAAWLTPGTVIVIGRQVAASITAYRGGHGRSPTWAEAPAGIDPALLTPMTSAPPDWPHRGQGRCVFRGGRARPAGTAGWVCR